eukprot:NODE_508_length_7458_cov_0.132491.p10 type:complete len:108 gc:universal NODE_508_length_7458_cov_0.132491:2009-2332(+)
MDESIKRFNMNYIQQLKNDLLYLESAFAIYSVNVSDPKLLLLHELMALLATNNPDQYLIESVRRVKYPHVTKIQAHTVLERLINGDKTLAEDVRGKIEKTMKILKLN